MSYGITYLPPLIRYNGSSPHLSVYFSMLLKTWQDIDSYTRIASSKYPEREMRAPRKCTLYRDDANRKTRKDRKSRSRDSINARK